MNVFLLQGVSGSDEPKVLCVIRDLTDADSTGRTILNLPQSCLVDDFIHQVGKQYNYDPDTFRLTFDDDDKSYEVSNGCSWLLL